MERNGELRRLVLDRLRHGWSPERIAGRLDYEGRHRHQP
jgi:IS30 family transposase